MKYLSVLLLAMAPLVVSQSVHGQSLELNPGMWETTMTRTNPFTGVPESDTVTECVTQKSFNPKEMARGAQECTLKRQDLTGNVLTFAMDCGMDEGQASIEGRYETDGQTGNGEMIMNMSMGGQNMSMTMNWQARRLGDC